MASRPYGASGSSYQNISVFRLAKSLEKNGAQPIQQPYAVTCHPWRDTKLALEDGRAARS